MVAFKGIHSGGCAGCLFPAANYRKQPDQSDAAIAMISASSLAIGIIVTSLTTGMTTDVSSYMFGSILAMTKEDMLWL